MLRAVFISFLVFSLAVSACAREEPSLANESETECSSRLVVAGAFVTELIDELGSLNCMVGRDERSIYPEKAREIPNIGGPRELGAEAIINLRPDTLFVASYAGPDRMIDRVQEAGVNVVRLMPNYTKDNIVENVRTVAAHIGEIERGDNLIRSFEREYEQVFEETHSADPTINGLFVVSVGDNGLVASGGGTAADAIFHLANIENGATHMGVQPISLEVYIQSEIDTILLVSEMYEILSDEAALRGENVAALFDHPNNPKLIHLPANQLLSTDLRLPRTALKLRCMTAPLPICESLEEYFDSK